MLYSIFGIKEYEDSRDPRIGHLCMYELFITRSALVFGLKSKCQDAFKIELKDMRNHIYLK